MKVFPRPWFFTFQHSIVNIKIHTSDKINENNSNYLFKIFPNFRNAQNTLKYFTIMQIKSTHYSNIHTIQISPNAYVNKFHFRTTRLSYISNAFFFYFIHEDNIDQMYSEDSECIDFRQSILYFICSCFCGKPAYFFPVVARTK